LFLFFPDFTLRYFLFFLEPLLTPKTGMQEPASLIARFSYFFNCVERIEPTRVSSAGGDVITLFGSQFPQDQLGQGIELCWDFARVVCNTLGLNCNFRDPGTNMSIQSKATWISETQMTCVTPIVSTIGKGPVSLSWSYSQDPSTTPMMIIYDNSRRKKKGESV
jgi:hypothetical protein